MELSKNVSFELGKLLKSKGFNIAIRNFYLLKENGKSIHEGFEDDYWGDNRIENWNKDVVGIKPFEGFVSAPSIAEVIDWLYETHKVWISVNYIDDVLLFGYSITNIISNILERAEWKINSPSEAYEAAIEYCLNKII